jgi:hypothetical protein
MLLANWLIESNLAVSVFFESLPLRHAVSTAEKLCYVAPEICEKGRLFAIFHLPTGPEKKRLLARFTPVTAVFLRSLYW